MSENWELIGQAMLQLVEDYFPLAELKDDMSEFVLFKIKNHFPFGQLAILHYRMFNGRSEDIVQAAAAVELMILSLDIFDDLQDQDNFSVPWHKVDQAVAMNIATAFLTLSFRALEQTSFEPAGIAKAKSYLNTMIIKAVNGQHLDLLNRIESEDEYIQMVRQKSGSLMAAACLVGTVLASEQHHDSVKNYAEQLGIIAQIKNDISDICRWDEKNDLLNKRRTLPTLYLLYNQQPQYQLIRDYYDAKFTKEELTSNRIRIQELVEKSGVLEYARVILRVNQFRAVELIKGMNIAQEWQEKLWQYL